MTPALFAPTRTEVLGLVESAVQAPSADNEHHVRFALREGGIDLRSDAFFDTCSTPHRRVLILLSFGAVVENLRLALLDRGWSLLPRCFPEADDPTLLLRIHWHALQPTGERDSLFNQIGSRHTNRRFFRGPPMTTVEGSALESALASIPGVVLHRFDEGAARRALLTLMRRAETARFGDREHHRELFGSIDFSRGWNTPSTRHIAAGALEIEQPLRIPFRTLRHWPVMNAAGWLGLHHCVGFRAGDLPARFAPHLWAITSTLPRDDAALAAGAAFQRVWLAASELGLALQPMVAAAVLTDDVRSDRSPSDLARALTEGWAGLIGERRRPLVVFRVGRAPLPRIRSRREPVGHYLLDTVR